MRLVLLPLAFAAASAFAQTSATLSIETSHPVGQVSPTLNGIMSEEINHAWDGGLYAELLNPRTFQPNRRLRPDRWIPKRPSPSILPPVPAPRSRQASVSMSRPPTLTPLPVSSTPVTGASPSAHRRPTTAPSTRKPLIPRSAPSPSVWSTTRPALSSLRPPCPPSTPRGSSTPSR
jgi:hypothetical protein